MNQILQKQNKFILQLVSYITFIEKELKKHRKMVYVDKTTGLFNKLYIEEKLEKDLSGFKKNNFVTAVSFIDINEFKNVNDTKGYSTGDLVLRELGNKLKTYISKNNCLVIYYGEDSYLIVINDINEQKIYQKLKDIMKTLVQPIKILNGEINLSFSIGVSYSAGTKIGLPIMLQNADIALNEAKKKGKNVIEIYNAQMKKHILKRIRISEELIHSIDNEEFEVVYQPKFNPRTEKIIGAEALLRWNSKALGQVSPLEFIPAAEDIGIIIPIGEYVLKNACRQIKYYESIGCDKFTIAVNLSPVQFKDKNLINIIRNTLNETKINPSHLELEITEGMVIEDFEQSKRLLKEIQEIGINICIDDFGTGYSSFSYFNKLPIDVLKIDKTFIDYITTDKKQNLVVKNIIEFAHILDLKVVAEGVESYEQAQILKEYSCDELQGYFFSKPLKVKDMNNLIKDEAYVFYKEGDI